MGDEKAGCSSRYLSPAKYDLLSIKSASRGMNGDQWYICKSALALQQGWWTLLML